jgi:hypothetical protein
MRKRTTTKTGNFTKSTRTISSTRGVTHSSSSRPPGGPTRRTVSFNNGKMRTTHTRHHGGGWSTTKSKTVALIRKIKPSQSKTNGGIGSFARVYSDSSDTTLWDIVKGLILYGLLYVAGLIGLVTLAIIFLLFTGNY